jgi:hypothetical protein
MDLSQLADPICLVPALILGVGVSLVASVLGVSRKLATIAALTAVLGGASYPGGPGALFADAVRPLRSLTGLQAERRATRAAAVAEATGEAASGGRR